MNHLLALMLCVASLHALAGPGAWQGLGPPGGNVGHIIADVDSPDTFYAETRVGIFRSVDRGVTWMAAQQGLGATSNLGGGTTFGGNAPTLLSSVGAVYVVGQGCRTLYRSTDRALTWAPTGFVANACITALTMTSGPTPRLLVATAGSQLLASTDGGATFTQTGSGLPAGFTMHSLAANPSQPGIVLSIPRDPAIPNPSIHVSSDGGDSWTPIAQTGPFPITVFPYSQFSFGAGSTVYLASLGLFRSDDGGLSWTTYVFADVLTLIAAHPEEPDSIYYVGFDGHVYFSHDNAATSTPVSIGHVMANSADSATISSLVLDRVGAHDDLLVGTIDAGFFQRTAGTWTRTNAGLHATPIRGIAQHPLADGYLLAGIADVGTPSPGVLRSIDAGVSWEPANSGLRARNVRSIVIDPTTAASVASTVVYATGTATTTASAGIWKSVNGGTQWTPIDAGLPQATAPSIVRQLLIDPRSCASPPAAPAHCVDGPLSTLYAVGNGPTVGATTTHRLIRSTDAGASWTDIDGLPQPDFSSGTQTVTAIVLALDPLDTQRLFAGTLASISAPEPTIPNGVFMSTDGGANWTLRSNGLPLYPGSTSSTHNDVFALAIDPHTAGRLWAETSVFGQSDSSVIYRSTDYGANWMPSSAGITAGDIRQIVVDPNASGTLYAAAAGFLFRPAGIYKSSDGGDSWRSISVGLDGNGATTLAIDPFDPHVLYAGTRNGIQVMQQLPDTDRDGVPDAIEQAGPGGGDGNGDGIPDYQQSNVATIDLASDAGRWQAQAGVSPGASGEGFLTIAVSALNPGTCTQLVDAQAVRPGDRPGDVDAEGIWAHDVPLVRFEILDCPAADVTLTWSSADFDGTDSMRFFGPFSIGMNDMRWVDFGPASERLDAQTWRIQLTAGSLGNYRPLASGAILFEGGPASADRIFRHGFE